MAIMVGHSDWREIVALRFIWLQERKRYKNKVTELDWGTNGNGHVLVAS